MRAINLIPADARGGRAPRAVKLAPPTYGLLGLLAAGLVLVTLYVLASNSVNDRQAKLTSLHSQLAQAQAEAAQLGSYAQFASMAHTRVQAVRGIAATRFDWNAALTNLARIVPADTSLQGLTATVVPGANAGGGGGSSQLYSALPGPAFDMQGCTATQDDVARLISRLRTMSGVSRVVVTQSQKSASAQAGVTAASSNPGGCKPNAPSFNLLVFFQPVAGAGPQGAQSLGGAATPTATSGGSK